MAIPLVLICAFILRESPRFLTLKDRQSDLRKVMSWLAPGRAPAYAEVRFTTTEDVRHKGSVSRRWRCAPEP